MPTACPRPTGVRLLVRLPSQTGVLAKYGIELIGAKLPSIDRAEDRELFKQAMYRIGLKCAPSGARACDSTNSLRMAGIGIGMGGGGASGCKQPADALQTGHGP